MRIIIVFFLYLVSGNKSYAQSGICGFVSQAQHLFYSASKRTFGDHTSLLLSYEIFQNAFNSIASLPNVPDPIRKKAKLLTSQFNPLSTPAIQLVSCLTQEAQIYPNAFTIGISAFFDVGVGGIISSEFLFYINPDLTMQIIQYKVKGARVGASLQAGAEVSIGLVYEMDNPDYYNGAFVGIGVSAELKLGVGATIYAGVPKLLPERFKTGDDFIEYLMFQAPVPFVISVSGNIGAGAGVQASYTYYTEVFRYNRLLETVDSFDGPME